MFAELPADLDTPLSAYLRLRPGPYAFLLESVEGGEVWARYSFLGADPLMVLTAKNGRLTLRRGTRTERLPDGDPLQAVRELLRQFMPVSVPGLPRFQGGAVGYLAYDMVHHMERLPRTTKDDLGLPDAVFLFTDTLLVFDNLRHRLLVIANAVIDRRDAASLDRAYDRAAVRIGMTLGKLARPVRAPAALALPSTGALLAQGEDGFTSTMSEQQFVDGVRRAKEFIASGDAYQIVLSRRLDCRRTSDPFTIYRALRTINPSPYLFLLQLGHKMALVGSSPEVLVRVEGNQVALRPIAGTRPRGASEAQDRRIAEEMLADPKERAEHVMLVDLGRNDVGRVSELGSVKVTEFMGIERYSHVMHLVSHVTGTLRAGTDAFDVLRACFPAGTLSGAPKIRAMEIIDELEPTQRGPYGGAVGYVSYSGNLDSCITIRTVVCHGSRASVQVGAGIVADSDPKTEWLETCSKARGMLLALRIAAGSPKR